MTNANRTGKRHFLFSLLSVLSIFVLMTATLTRAQLGAGGLAGVVADPQGAVLPGASVTLTNTETHSVYTGTTNNDGRFLFTNVSPGVYSLKIADPGFKTEVQSGITVSVGSTSTLNVALQVGATTSQVEVEANVQQLQTESSDVASIVSPKLIQQLPMNFSGIIRSPLQFIELTPGFEGDSSGNPQSQASYKLNGGGSGQADAVLDGSSISLASPNYQWNFGISVEAVTEFNVQTSTFSAQFGRTGGGFVNVSTRAGTDSFHGGVYDLIKNNVFDANTWQANHQGTKRSVDTQNDFGGFGGGPVWIPKILNLRGKTFWFFTYEGFRYQNATPNYGSAPLPAMFNGDFSSVLNAQTPPHSTVQVAGNQIYDYHSCSGENTGSKCMPFQGNKIPNTYSIDPVSKNLMKFAAQPTDPSAGPYNNLAYTVAAPINDDLYSLRVDQNIGQNHKLYGSYSQADMPVVDLFNMPGTNPGNGKIFDGGFGSTTTHYVRLVEDWTINSHLINHVNAGFTKRYRIEEAPNSAGQWNSQTGFTGEYQDLMFPNFGVAYGLAPNGFVLPGGNIGFFTDGSYEFDDNLTWNKGNHTFSFGIGHRRQGFSSVYDSNAAADFNFTNVLTSAGEYPANDPSGNAGKPIDSNSGNGLASFFFGAASGGTIGGPSVASMRARYWDFYGQDDWKVSPKMTINLGLRYEIPEPVEEHKCWSSQVNFGTPNAKANGLPGAMEFQGRGTSGGFSLDGRCSPMDKDWKAWGPRLGGVYQLNDKTVVRAAYGVYYTPLKVSNFANTDSGGFSLPGFKWPTQGNLQEPAVYPSLVKSYPGDTTLPHIDPTEYNGLVGGGGAATGGAVMLPSRLAKPGLVQNWTFDIQRQLPKDWLLDIAYVGNHGQNLQALEKDPNVLHDHFLAYGDCLGVELGQMATNAACQAAAAKGLGLPSPTGPYGLFINDFGSNGYTEDTVAQALRPFPMFQTEDLDTSFSPNPWGNYTYEAMQIKMTKRYGNGLTVLANYTWSKNLTNADSDYAPQSSWNGGSSAGLLDPDNPGQQKSISEFDQPQNIKVAYTYELPFGNHRPYMNHANYFVNLVAGEWTIGGIDSYGTGYPIGVGQPGTTVGTFAGDATGPSHRPNVVQGQSFKSYTGGSGGYKFGTDTRINPAAFVSTGNYAFGNAPRLLSNVRGFFHKDEDLQVGKPFPLVGERVVLNFRFDAFNIFNRHSYGCMDNNVGDLNFGKFTCGAGPNAEVNNNIVSSVPPSRTMQGNLRLTF